MWGLNRRFELEFELYVLSAEISAKYSMYYTVTAITYFILYAVVSNL